MQSLLAAFMLFGVKPYIIAKKKEERVCRWHAPSSL